MRVCPGGPRSLSRCPPVRPGLTPSNPLLRTPTSHYSVLLTVFTPCFTEKFDNNRHQYPKTLGFVIIFSFVVFSPAGHSLINLDVASGHLKEHRLYGE